MSTLERSVPTPAQSRVLAAALDLFAEHSVAGTSLQMIADRLGVTKAAVYHRYRAKEEIVLAVAESELARLEEVVTAAEAEPKPSKARNTLLVGMIDLAIERGSMVTAMLTDPVVGQLFAEHEPFREIMNRLSRVLHGGKAGRDAHVETAILVAAISGALMHPFTVNVNDDVLRTHLLRLARCFLGLPS